MTDKNQLEKKERAFTVAVAGFTIAAVGLITVAVEVIRRIEIEVIETGVVLLMVGAAVVAVSSIQLYRLR